MRLFCYWHATTLCMDDVWLHRMALQMVVCVVVVVQNVAARWCMAHSGSGGMTCPTRHLRSTLAPFPLGSAQPCVVGAGMHAGLFAMHVGFTRQSPQNATAPHLPPGPHSHGMGTWLEHGDH